MTLIFIGSIAVVLAAIMIYATQADELSGFNISSWIMSGVYLVVIVAQIFVYLSMRKHLKALPANFYKIRERFTRMFITVLLSYVFLLALIIADLFVTEGSIYDNSIHVASAILQLVPIFCVLYLHNSPKDTDERKEVDQSLASKQWV